jgi:hypothetical protein
LAVNEGLAAPGQRDEQPGDVEAQQSLVGGQAQGLPVYGTERVAHLTDLVPTRHGQLLGLDDRRVQGGPYGGRLWRAGQCRDRAGQLGVRDRQGGPAQGT